MRRVNFVSDNTLKAYPNFIFLKYSTWVDKAKRDHVLGKNKGSDSFALAGENWTADTDLFCFSFTLMLKTLAVQKLFYVESKCSCLNEKYVFQKGTVDKMG